MLKKNINIWIISIVFLFGNPIPPEGFDYNQSQRQAFYIFQSADMAVDCALEEVSGVIGLDEKKNNQLQCIGFERIRGGKLFNSDIDWFQSMLKDIKQI